MSLPTSAQAAAISARGNLIVVAGAGTGKTSTLVARCLDLLANEASLDRLLLVTFTEAAATEMRHRLGEALRQRAQEAGDSPAGTRLREQAGLLDLAQISTLHGFCLRLVRENFHALELDPDFKVLDEQQTGPLRSTTLAELFDEHYARRHPHSEAVLDLIRRHGGGDDERIASMVTRLHDFAQTLAEPDWLTRQAERFNAPEPAEWRAWLATEFAEWRQWLPRLRPFAGEAVNVAQAVGALAALPAQPSGAEMAAALGAVAAAGQAKWKRGTTGIRDQFAEFFEAASFLDSLTAPTPAGDGLAEDWAWLRGPMLALLRLTGEFGERFTAAKRAVAGVDFSDLEQLTLRLLREPGTGRPTALAEDCQRQFDFVFVDEYQDINAAQDAILTALGRAGSAANRFLVGDVKQSIYQFRLANPAIFRRYERDWASGDAGQRIALTANFRSRPEILAFVNSLCGALMRDSVGGVDCEELVPGRADAADGDVEPRVELHLIAPDEEEAGEDTAETSELADLLATEREARLVALRLREMHGSGRLVLSKKTGQLEPVKWSDMVVLLRAPGSRVEAYAKEFSRAGVPLQARRDGFFASLDVGDLLNLLRLLDNPLQDIPALAVLRSPLVGLSLDELAEIRAHNDERLFWAALRRFANDEPASEAASALRLGAWQKATVFLRQFDAWRERVRHASLSQCLDAALAETHYEALLLTEPRGPERLANVRRFVDLTRAYDPYQRQGLHRFLRFVAAQEEAETDLEPASAPAGDAVQLMSIHQSKGLEWPVVVLAGLGTGFNLRDLSGDLLLDEALGLGAKVITPDGGARFPSLPHWRLQKQKRRQVLGEELRLLYVAATRARDWLLLTGTTRRRDTATWTAEPPHRLEDAEILGAKSHLEWLRLWLPLATRGADAGESSLLRWWTYRQTDVRLVLPGVASGPPPSPPPEERAPARASEEETAEQLTCIRAKLAWRYPHVAATKEHAKTSVSALRERAAELADDDAATWIAPRVRRRGSGGALSGAELGTLHHEFLQALDLTRAGSEADIRAQAEALAGRGPWTLERLAQLDFAALSAFWNSPAGRRIRQNAAAVWRELPFTAAFTPGELGEITGAGVPVGGSDDDFIVVQGVADLAVILPGEIWLLDYKTDAVTAATLADKVAAYRPQLRLYALALQRIHQRPVTNIWLHFLAVQQTVTLEDERQGWLAGLS